MKQRTCSQPPLQYALGMDVGLTQNFLLSLIECPAFYFKMASHQVTWFPSYFEKSRWAIAAIFSIMKANAASVPLDLSQPFKRIHEIVQETKSKHVATSKYYAKAFTQKVPLEPLIIDQDLIDSLSPELYLVYTTEPSQVAFVMFIVSCLPLS